ncbi:MAG: hypothetical protein COT67_00480, partial [Candidatus Tagabacteria bacterium CG09_land_8_20_14_0_10_41_14]
MKKLGFIFILMILFLPFSAFAGVVINEIMYDLEGADAGREWVEIFNNGDSEIDISGWKFYENDTNHKINLVDENGDFIMSAGSYAIIADNFSKFLIDWPDFSGIIFDSVFSLSNTGETIAIRDTDLNDADSVSYLSDWGAAGDGNSLQKINGEWMAANPTPGAQNSLENSDQNIEESSGAAQPAYIPPKELATIKAYAGEDRVLVAGSRAE